MLKAALVTEQQQDRVPGGPASVRAGRLVGRADELARQGEGLFSEEREEDPTEREYVAWFAQAHDAVGTWYGEAATRRAFRGVRDANSDGDEPLAIERALGLLDALRADIRFALEHGAA